MIKDLMKMTAVSLVSVLVLAGPVFAQPGADRPSKGKHQHHGREMPGLMQQLDLTDEQKAKIDQQRQQHREQQEALEQQIQQKRTALREELEKAETDAARVQQLAADLKNLMGQKIDQRIQGILSMKEILTPEQFLQFQKKVRQFRKHHGRRGGKWQRRQGSDDEQPPAPDEREGDI